MISVAQALDGKYCDLLSQLAKWVVNQIAAPGQLGRPICPRAAAAIENGEIYLAQRAAPCDFWREFDEILGLYSSAKETQKSKEFSILFIYRDFPLLNLNELFHHHKELLLRRRILLGRFHPLLLKTLLDDDKVSIPYPPFPVIAFRELLPVDRRFLINRYTSTDDSERIDRLFQDALLIST